MHGGYGLLNTIYSNDKKAYVKFSKNNEPTKGVVLFMHGYSQPKSYFTLFRRLSEEGFTVIAPCPSLEKSDEIFQARMIDDTLHFNTCIRNNELLKSGGEIKTALVAHSIGASLAVHVACQADRAKLPFKAVMMLAPTCTTVDYLDTTPLHSCSCKTET
jgi:alpha-beta hydrolase superfamily lysophospholipase